MAETWRNCTACKNPIPFNGAHWVCSVSTCNGKATRYVFCTVSCWDSHVSDARHRDAWAVEARAPSKDAWDKELATNPPAPTPPPRQMPVGSPSAAPVVRRVVGDVSPSSAAAVTGSAAAGSGNVTLSDVTDKDVLIVVSKLKKYIKDRSGFNTSDGVMDLLSEHVRAVCDEAIKAAARDERKTVLDRDIPRPRR